MFCGGPDLGQRGCLNWVWVNKDEEDSQRASKDGHGDFDGKSDTILLVETWESEHKIVHNFEGKIWEKKKWPLFTAFVYLISSHTEGTV